MFPRASLAAALSALAVAFVAAHAKAEPPRVAGNPAERLVSLPIDPYGYDHAKSCRKSPAKGARALQDWLQSNAGGAFWGIMRCSRLSGSNYSLHAEGRAIDWHLDVHRTADKREAARLIALLLAPDSAGNAHALARRMGIQEIIWDCRSWWSGSEGMRPYSVCYDREGRRKRVDDTSAHRDHIHFGLNWRGAKKKTTFWVAGGR